MEIFAAYDWKPFQSCFESFMSLTINGCLLLQRSNICNKRSLMIQKKFERGKFDLKKTLGVTL
jgi:hypothetical protein